jgi:cadmium resistance protein CadD (predicted permease)
MVKVLALVSAAVVAFVATNVDDLFLLLLFFGEGRRLREIVLGQYLGFAAIVAASLLVAAGSFLFRPSFVGFLGVAPLAIGLKELLFASREKDDEAPRARAGGVVEMAIVTFASGGDNIAVYAPLFARRPLPSIGAIVAVFVVMVPLWCAGARALVRLPAVAAALDRWGKRLAPFVLVALGVYVFVAEGALAYVLARL